MGKLCLALFFILHSMPILADEPSLLEFDYHEFETSDNLELQFTSVMIRNHRRDLFWNYLGAVESNFDYGLFVQKITGDFSEKISGQKSMLFLGQKWNFSHYTYIYLGKHEFKYGDKTSDLFNYKLGHDYMTQRLSANLELEKDFIYKDGNIPGPLEKSLHAVKLNLLTTFFYTERLKFKLNLRQNLISDDNKSQQNELAILYGRAYPLWIWGGYHLEQLKFDEKTVNYWSPETFYSHGPSIEVGRDFENKWGINSSYTYRIIKEDNFEAGTSYYIALGVKYGERNKSLGQLSFFENKSQQGSNEWWSKGFRFHYQLSF